MAFKMPLTTGSSSMVRGRSTLMIGGLRIRRAGLIAKSLANPSKFWKTINCLTIQHCAAINVYTLGDILSPICAEQALYLREIKYVRVGTALARGLRISTHRGAHDQAGVERCSDYAGRWLGLPP